ncbi:MAG: hypothetical protein FWG67_04300 [Defluviitaleaceae bacterium]|nr:hypothetical protein [Defluviitaleaceae bacterium]
MYTEFDSYISGNFSDDYWYDEGCLFAEEILLKFSNDDWEQLRINVSGKSSEWKCKLAYIIEADQGVDGLNILLSMIDENQELLMLVIDSLRSFDSEEYKKIIMQNSQAISRAQGLTTSESLPVKLIAQDFLKKISALIILVELFGCRGGNYD